MYIRQVKQPVRYWEGCLNNMSDLIASQLAYLLGSFIYGFAIFAVYDILRTLRVFVKHLSLFVWIEDCLFWLVAAVIVFDMVYERNNGILRAFSLITLFLGMLLYRIVVGDRIVTIMKRLQKLLKKRINQVIMKLRQRLQR